MSQSKDIVEIFELVTKEYLSKSQANIFVEKINSMNLNRFNFINSYFPHSKIIHIVRDGRDCYCSARNHPYVFQGKNITRYAKYWKHCINNRVKIKNDNNIFDIKYEDLTNNPEKILKEIMEIIGLYYDPIQIDPNYYGKTKLKKQKSHQELANEINSFSQFRWKKELSKKEIKKFEKIAGNQLQKMGYQIDYNFD